MERLIALPITVSSYVQGGMRGKICQAARTKERVKSLELQTIPDLTHRWGYTLFLCFHITEVKVD